MKRKRYPFDSERVLVVAWPATNSAVVAMARASVAHAPGCFSVIRIDSLPPASSNQELTSKIFRLFMDARPEVVMARQASDMRDYLRVIDASHRPVCVLSSGSNQKYYGGILNDFPRTRVPLYIHANVHLALYDNYMRHDIKPMRVDRMSYLRQEQMDCRLIHHVFFRDRRIKEHKAAGWCVLCEVRWWLKECGLPAEIVQMIFRHLTPSNLMAAIEQPKVQFVTDIRYVPGVSEILYCGEY